MTRFHVLKCWPSAFEALSNGTKAFEWRKDDRDYQVGDVLKIRRWDPVRESFLSDVGFPCKECEAPVLFFEVTYLLRGQFDVPNGYVIMSLRQK